MTDTAGVVTFLFTDLVGSTHLLDRLGDEGAEPVSRRHFSLLRNAVAEAGGREVKSLGDGLMVAFTSPVAAVSCAVAMQRSMARFNEGGDGPALRIRTGLHAGEPLPDRDDYFGSTVVIARRLCDRAEGGQILASEVVAGLVGSRGGFSFRPAGRLTLKGFARPMATVIVDWAADAAVAAATGVTAPAAKRLATPRGPSLVGRRSELAILEGELDRSSHGEFRIVLLLADPGVGKTRLAGEVLARNGEAAVGLSARAHPLGGTTSFGLWAEALEGHLRSLDPAEVSDLCGGFVDDLGGLLRSAAAVRGAAPAAEPPRARLLEGLAVLLDRLSRRSPVVILLDDVHVADASSWDALHYLARNLGTAPVLVLAAARPAELAGQQGPNQILLGLEQDGLLTGLPLRPLSSEAVCELVAGVLREQPPLALVGWLEQRSRGNPLFTLGLLRALLEEGADLGAPRLQRLPEGLAERVTARLAMLDEPSRSVLEVLAVVGRRVDLGAVAEFSGRPLDRVGPILDDLVRTRLVAEEERGHEVTYEITHPLIQEAIHQNLGTSRRRALHRLVARSLLSARRLGEAAPHFVRSAQAGDTEAIEALCGAMRQAEERNLYREALTLLGSLVELVPRGDERWLEVLDGMVLQAEWVADHRADVHAALAIPALRAIDDVLGVSADPARRAAVKFRLASFLSWGAGELEEAERVCRDARGLYRRAGNDTGAWLASLELAYIQWMHGSIERWAEGGRQVVEEAEAAGDRFATMQALGRGVGWAGLMSGSFTEADTALAGSVLIARELGRTYFQSMCVGARGCVLAFEGRLPEAYPLLTEARAIDPTSWRESVLPELELAVHWLAGTFDTAVDQARESLTWNSSGMSRRRAHSLAFGVLANVETGRLVEARRLLDVAVGAYGELGSWSQPRTTCLHAGSVLEWCEGKPGAALIQMRRNAPALCGYGALTVAAFAFADLAELAGQERDAGAVAEAATGLAALAARLDRDLYRGLAAMASAWDALTAGDVPRATASAEQAVALLDGLGYTPFSARALDVLGRALSSRDRSRAREVLERTAAMFDGCGAVWRRDRALDALRRLGGARSARSAPAAGRAALSAREREVARLAVQGRTAPHIARELFIGERTVESHLARIYAKLGVASKFELAQRAAELGLAE